MAVRFAEDFAGIALGAVVDTSNTAFTTLAGTGRFIAAEGFFGVAARMETANTLVTLRSNLGSVAPFERWCRFYLTHDQSLPAGQAHYVFSVRAGGTGLGGLRMDDAHRWHLRNGAENLTGPGQITTPVPVGELVRVEYHPDLAAGTQEARLFVGAQAHGSTPTHVLTGPLAATSFDNFVIGSVGGNVMAARFEAVVADDAGYPAPLVDPTPPPPAVTSHLRETWGVPL